MSETLQHILALEARLKDLEVTVSSSNAPAWRDVAEMADKLKETESRIVDLQIELSRVKQLSRSDVQKMIDVAGIVTTDRISNTLQDVFADDKWRGEITEKAVDLLRAEMKATIGAAAGSAQSAQAVARASIDASMAMLKSASHYFSRGA